MSIIRERGLFEHKFFAMFTTSYDGGVSGSFLVYSSRYYEWVESLRYPDDSYDRNNRIDVLE